MTLLPEPRIRETDVTPDQYKRLNSIYVDPIYLLNYENDVFAISGATKNVYKITLYPTHDAKKYGSFYCNCPDMNNHARKKNVYCKHICFVYSKICKFNRPAFYATKWLSPDELAQLYEKMNRLATVADPQLQNKTLIDKYNNMSHDVITTHDQFKVNIKNKVITDMECPICFDPFVDTPNLFCQTCGNVVHEQCMEKWLEARDDCIYCRFNNMEKLHVKTSNNQ